MLQSQLGSLQVEADAEVPSAFSLVLEWFTCKSLLAQRLVVDLVLPFAIDLNPNIFVAFLFDQQDFDVSIGSSAGFHAEFRHPILPFFAMLVLTVRLLDLVIA